MSTPASPAHENRRDIEVDVRVEPDGSAELTMSVTSHGMAGVLWNSLARDLRDVPAPRREALLERLFDQVALGFAANGRVYSYYFPTEASPERPFQLSATVMFPQLAVRDAEAVGVAMPLPVFSGDRLAAFADEAGPRLQPVQFEYPFQDDLRVHVRLPEGSQVTRLPGSVSLDNGQGSFFAIVRSQGVDVFYYSRLVVRHPWIGPEGYPAFRQVADAEASVLKDPMVFIPPTAANRIEDTMP